MKPPSSTSDGLTSTRTPTKHRESSLETYTGSMSTILVNGHSYPFLTNQLLIKMLLALHYNEQANMFSNKIKSLKLDETPYS